MFIFYFLGVGLPCRSIFCQFWLCEEVQCVYLRRHLGSPDTSLFLKIFYLLFFLERGEGREKKTERNINMWLPFVGSLQGIWPTTQACALTGNQICEPLPQIPALNPLIHSNQGKKPLCIALLYRLSFWL